MLRFLHDQDPETHVNNKATKPNYVTYLYHGNTRCNFHFKNYKNYERTVHEVVWEDVWEGESLHSGCGEGSTARDDRVVITLEEAGEIWNAVSSCICLKSAIFQKSRSRETNNTYQLLYAPIAKAVSSSVDL